MRLDRRQAIIGALALAFAAGCTPKAEGPSDAEVLAAGTTELDGIALPADWRPRGKEARRSGSRLVWTRDYSAPGAPADVLRTVDDAAVAAGWKRSDDCLDSNGNKCFTYTKAGFYLSPSAVATKCADGTAACSSLLLSMRLA